jgi:hypothetical protein
MVPGSSSLNPNWITPILSLPDPKHCIVGSVADPDPGSGALLTPGSGIRDGKTGIRDGKKVSIRIRDEQPGSYILELRNHFLG